jgi:hypothetical protein
MLSLLYSCRITQPVPQLLLPRYLLLHQLQVLLLLEPLLQVPLQELLLQRRRKLKAFQLPLLLKVINQVLSSS